MKYPLDIDKAAGEWNASCGPASLAAILDLSLAETRPLLNGFEKRGYMNITHVQNALKAANVAFRPRLKTRPSYGLVFIQWGGHEKKPAFVQYQFTHWIAVAGETVFEVNAPYLVAWDEWKEQMPEIMKEAGAGDGTFFIRSAIEVLDKPQTRPVLGRFICTRAGSGDLAVSTASSLQHESNFSSIG